MSDDRLLSALNASESVEKSKKNLDNIKSTRSESYNADKTLKTTMPNLKKSIKPLQK